MKIVLLAYFLLIAMAMAGAVPEKYNIELADAVNDPVDISPANVLAADGDLGEFRHPCSRKCTNSGQCCKKDECAYGVCLGPHLGPRDVASAIHEYARANRAPLADHVIPAE